MKPNGDIDPSVDPFIIKYREDEDASGNKNRAPGYVPQRYDEATDSILPAIYSAGHMRVYPYSLKLPEWTQTKGARFMIFQRFSGSVSGNTFNVSGVRYQRKNAMTSFARLDDPQASSFIRVGQGKGNQTAQQRRKRVRDMINASLKYGETKFGKGMFNSTNISESKKESFEKDLKYVKEIYSEWKNKLMKESGWTPTTSPITNSTSQTFTYSAPNSETGEPNTFTTSGLGGVESQPSSVKVNYGFGETENVSPPSYNQLALAGYAKPILMKRRDTEEVNPKLDASQEFAKKNNSDVMMNARVKTGELSLEQKKEFVEIYKNNIEEWNKKSEVRARENERRRKSNVSKVRSFVGKFGANFDKIKGVQTFMKITQGGKKLVVIHQDNMFRDFSNKFNVRVYEAKGGKKISKLTGNFGRVDGSMFDLSLIHISEPTRPY